MSSFHLLFVLLVLIFFFFSSSPPNKKFDGITWLCKRKRKKGVERGNRGGGFSSCVRVRLMIIDEDQLLSCLVFLLLFFPVVLCSVFFLLPGQIA